MSNSVVIRPAGPDDSAGIAALHERAMGPGRFARTAYRVRERAGEAFSSFCRVCLIEKRLAAAVRFTEVVIGGKAGALLLGRQASPWKVVLAVHFAFAPLLLLRPLAVVEMNRPGVWILGAPRAVERDKGLGIVIEYAGATGAPRWEPPLPRPCRCSCS